MELNKGAVGIFVILCVLGGATGFYLATSGSPQPVVDAAPLTPAPDSTEQPPQQQLTPAVQAQVPVPAASAVIERPTVRRASVPARPARPAATSEPEGLRPAWTAGAWGAWITSSVAPSATCLREGKSRNTATANAIAVNMATPSAINGRTVILELHPHCERQPDRAEDE